MSVSLSDGVVGGWGGQAFSLSMRVSSGGYFLGFDWA